MKIWLARTAWLLLAAAAGASSWLIIANQGGGQKPSAAPVEHGPDYTLQTAAITRYTLSGARHYLLDSTHIEHMRLTGISVLSNIKLNYYPGSAPYWHLTADAGRLSSDGDHAWLNGHVHALQPKLAVPIQFSTSRMRVWLSKRRIRSDAKVTIRQGARTTRGIGLRVDLDRGTVRLLSHVTSRYVQ
ncbi:MAG: LPS export ABC transporter periplasmic protein LptC [Gammaproteobacteria bacterium]